MAASGKIPEARTVFLSGMGAVYVFSIGSYYLQYPWVHGYDGLEPADVYVNAIKSHFDLQSTATAMQRYPLAIWPAVFDYGLDVDIAMEALCLIGLASAVLITCGFHHFLPFAVCLAVNHTMLGLAQSMSGFQWDIFVLECGLICVLYADVGLPFFGGKAKAKQADDSHQLRWAARVLGFKLFLLSGAGKILLGCPTWKNLTAMKYHYASQCIPTPLAYYADMLPEFVGKLSVAGILFIQLFCSFGLLSPFPLGRKLAGVLQIASMAAIQVTGNYNWFNINGALVCVLALAADVYPEASHFSRRPRPESWLSWRPKPTRARKEPAVKGVTNVDGTAGVDVAVLVAIGGLALATGCFDSLTTKNTRGTALAWAAANVLICPQVVRVLHFFAVVGLSAAAFYKSFATGGALRNNLAPEDVTALLDYTLPVVVPYVLYTIILVTVRRVAPLCVTVPDSIAGFAGRAWQAAKELCALACSFFVVTNSFAQFSADYPPMAGVLRGALGPPLQPAIQGCLDVGAPFTEAHLFGSYGLFRRMTGVGKHGEVAVPVLVLEYSTAADPKTWHPIALRYAVGPVDRPPPWVAPFQPRVDWRLWFAALGSVQSDPWVVSFAVKFMRNESAIMHLVSSGTVDLLRRTGRPARVRGSLYHYSFAEAGSKAWWRRKKVGSWLPPVAEHAPEFAPLLARRGLSLGRRPPRRPECPPAWAPLCETVREVREAMAPLRAAGAAWLFFAVLLAPAAATCCCTSRLPGAGCRRLAAFTASLRTRPQPPQKKGNVIGRAPPGSTKKSSTEDAPRDL
ncbi:hypothetical protein DIPPA_24162 [Diplonema papillatum]|nr:hypothetical protein DIPPA_24162 [Diplonema papillatum]